MYAAFSEPRDGGADRGEEASATFSSQTQQAAPRTVLHFPPPPML